MKTKDLLKLDLRDENNKEILMTALKKIKPLSKKKKITINTLEKFVYQLSQRYEVKVQGIYLDCDSGEQIIYHASLINTIDYTWSMNIYGISKFEVYAKIIIHKWSGIKTKEYVKK